MGKRKWKAGQDESAFEISFLRRFRIPIAIGGVLVVAIAIFIYRFNTSKYQYGDTRSDYNRALADCLQDRTRVASSGDAVEEAADACVRDTPGPANETAKGPPAAAEGR